MVHKKSQAKFIFYFVTIFVVVFILLYSLGLVPKAIKGSNTDTFRTLWDKSQTQKISNQVGQKVVAGESPVRIVIDKIGVDALISNPNTTKASTLDDYLLEGAVRYPGSGLLGVGNMLLFGHSTGFVIVNNQAYKTFNGLKNLVVGDMVKVYSSSKVYSYKVTSVVMKPASEVEISFADNKNKLTLTTCNVFASKEDRYVVEADYLP